MLGRDDKTNSRKAVRECTNISPHINSYDYTNLAKWQPAQRHTNPHSGMSPLPAVAILQDGEYVLRHTSPHGGTLGAKMADSAHIYILRLVLGARPLESQVVIRGPCPTKVRLCPTHPHGGTPAKMADCASHTQSHTNPYGGMAREGEGRGRSPERSAVPGAFAPILLGGRKAAVGVAKLKIRRGLLPPIFGGRKFAPPFLGPGELPHVLL